MDIGLAPDALVEQIFTCLDANKMTDGVHVRLMVTRGVKATPYQDPRATISPATIVIIPEWKAPKAEVVAKGLTLQTVNVRRGAPDVQDQKLNSHSKLNCITACVQAMNAGADEALMLDPSGFCCDLQFDAFLHREARRGLDLERTILHPGHHSRRCDPTVQGERHSDLREAVLAL